MQTHFDAYDAVFENIVTSEDMVQTEQLLDPYATIIRNEQVITSYLVGGCSSDGGDGDLCFHL